jgi:hypothetical protein
MINNAESQRCRGCERLKPRPTLECQKYVPIWGKTLFKVSVVTLTIDLIASSTVQQESSNSQSFESPLSNRVEQPRVIVKTKRKVGRPKKVRPQENDGAPTKDATAASASVFPFPFENAEVCNKMAVGGFHDQSKFSSSKKHRKTKKSSRKHHLNSQLGNADTSDIAKRKRGRPKKVQVPANSITNAEQPSADGTASDFQYGSTCNSNSHIETARPKSKKRSKKHKKPTKNRNSLQIDPSPHSQLDDIPVSIKRKVGRPKKVRVLQHSVVSAENCVFDNSDLRRHETTVIAAKIKSSNKHPVIIHAKKCHPSRQSSELEQMPRIEVDLTSSKHKHRQLSHDNSVTEKKRGPGKTCRPC